MLNPIYIYTPLRSCHSHEVATSSTSNFKERHCKMCHKLSLQYTYLTMYEISIVSSSLLLNTSKRLQEITGKQEVRLGGLSIIAVVDCHQLPARHHLCSTVLVAYYGMVQKFRQSCQPGKFYT